MQPVNPSSHAATSAAKRKRTQPTTTFSSTPLYSRDVNSMSFDNDSTSQQQPMEATPNPKPRKQGRIHPRQRQSSLESPTGTSFRRLGSSSPVFNDSTHTPSRSKTKMTQVKKSPHPNNPNADFIIDVPALVLPTRKKNVQSAKSRRSATPFIPYEPPTDVFTPPREVFLSPVAKSSKRKMVASASSFKSAKGKSKLTIVTAVKQELPDIDLTLPMPPPSPSDDPLLLSGPLEFDFLSEPTPPRKREMSVQVQAIDEDVLPPSSPESLIAMDEEAFDWDCSNNNDIVSDISTDDEGEEEAEEQEVRRMSIEPEQLLALNEEEAEEREVRRMSVEPERLLMNEEEEEEHEVRQMSVEPEQLLELNEEAEEAEEQEVRRMSVEPEQSLRDEEEQEVRRMSVEPERFSLLKNEEEVQEVRQMSVEPEQLLELNEEEETEEQEVRWMSVEPEQLLKNEEEAEEQEVRQMSFEPEQLLENEEEEEHEVRQISVEVDNDEELVSPFDNLDRLPLRYTENPACGNQPAFGISYRLEQDEDDDQISDDSDELNHGIVKITSADPRSAARAAAILKQVNIYYFYL